MFRSLPFFRHIVPSLGLALLMLVAACGTRSSRVPETTTATLPQTIRIGTSSGVATLPLEDYILGTVLAEVGPAGETPQTAAAIFRLQAILARTYAASHPGRHKADGYDLCDTTHCQVYSPQRIRTSRFAGVARQAVAETRGQVILFERRFAEALFHADCGGHTASAGTIWGGSPVPYLAGTQDDVPGETHRRWEYRATRQQVREALNAVEMSAVGDSLRAIDVVARDTSGRAAEVRITGDRTVTLRGEQLRTVLNRTFGYRAILSSRFSVQAAADTFVFEGSGFGHGVGLCQVGAAARLRRGDSISSVVAVYYDGAQLARLPARR
jgi:stage II sporulation protein D